LKVLLTTLNAKYIHINLAVRLLYHLNKDKHNIAYKEFSIKENQDEIANYCAQFNILAFSCYIWNITQTLAVIKKIKALNPDIKILLGGPEVSYEWKDIIAIDEIDYIITGEGEIPFALFLDAFPKVELIPNLVSTVKGYAEFEKSTLTEVIQARASATSMKIDANNLSPENIAKFQQAQEGLSGALSRLLVSVEKYPDLKANQNFLELQSQLEGTENRIAVERGRFNEMVQAYNKYVRSFPNNIFAGMFGFAQKGYFQAVAGSEKAPEVKF